MLTVRVCSKLKKTEGENRLFLQKKKKKRKKEKEVGKNSRFVGVLIKQLLHSRLLDMRWW